MALEFGALSGLAQDFQSNERINDLYRQEEAANRAKAMAEARAKMYADDVKYQNAANSYDNAVIKTANQKRIQELGDWISSNPDWSTNMQKRMEYNNRVEEIKNNPDVLRGMATDQALAELNKDLQEVAKNPEMYDTDAYDDLLRQRDNYLKFGNQKGVDGFNTEGAQPFIYRKPQEFKDLAKLGQERGNHFKSNPDSVDFQELNNGRDGAFILTPKPEVLNALAQEEYLANKRQYDVQYTSKGIDPIEQAKKFISSGIETKFDYGEKNTLGEQMALARFKHNLENSLSTPGADPYIESMVKPGYVKLSGDILSKTYGSNVPFTYMNDEKKPVKGMGDVFHFEGDMYDKEYREDQPYKKTGIKIAPGYVLKTLSWGKENNVIYDKWLDGKGYIVKPELSDSYEIIDSPPDEDGNSVKLLKVKGFASFDASHPRYRGEFNKHILTSKQRDALGAMPNIQSQQQNVPTYTIEQYKQSGWSDEMIKKAVNEGRIRIK